MQRLTGNFIIFLVALAAVLMAIAPMYAFADAAVRPAMDALQEGECIAGGGCVYAPKDVIRGLMKEAYEAGKAEAKDACRNQVKGTYGT